MTWFGWQIDYLLFLQSIREATAGKLDELFLNISNLGICPFALMLMCAIYWGISKKSGIYIIYCFFISHIINISLKLTACIQRPWIIDSRVTPPEIAFSTAGGFSFPSGHTAEGTALWGGIASSWWNNKIIRYIACAIVFLVLFSRNYLGVHTPQDVIVSLIIGICLLIGVKKLFDWAEQNNIRGYILLGIITILGILLCIYVLIKPYPDYCDAQGEKMHYITRIILAYSMMTGCFLEKKFINFDTENSGILDKIIRIIIGLCLLHIITHQVHDFIFSVCNDDFLVSECLYNIILAFYITIFYPSLIKISEIIRNLKLNRG